MNQPWYIRLGWWLCEKTGHLWIRQGWIYNGYYHRDCRLCGRIISEPCKEKCLDYHWDNPDSELEDLPYVLEAKQAPREALAQPEQEPVTLLPDGSAFGVMSFPLPKSHWLYAEREYRDGEYEPIELGTPILTHELRSAVVSAVRYAIRGATNCGKEMDFDPDALVQNAVYALCGPYTRHVDAVNISEERVHKTEKSIHEPVGYVTNSGTAAYLHRGVYLEDDTPLYTAPPKREWVGLTDEEIITHFQTNVDTGSLLSFADGVRYAEAKLKEKNCG